MACSDEERKVLLKESNFTLQACPQWRDEILLASNLLSCPALDSKVCVCFFNISGRELLEAILLYCIKGKLCKSSLFRKVQNMSYSILLKERLEMMCHAIPYLSAQGRGNNFDASYLSLRAVAICPHFSPFLEFLRTLEKNRSFLLSLVA